MISRAADEVDVVKLLDFGIVHTMAEPLARAQELVDLPPVTPPGHTTPRGRLTAAGSVVGTPGYIAPEQAVGVAVAERADLYALGCVAWWLLAGNELYPRPDEESAMRSHALEPIPELRPSVREVLGVALLAKRPEDRPREARAVIEALRAIEIPAHEAWTEVRAQRLD